MDEIWKDIEGYEGLYQVSSMGRLRSLDKIISYADGKSSHLKKGKLLKLSVGSHGYYVVNLTKNKKITQKTVHSLVCASFHGKRPQGFVTNHIDGQKKNNRKENLEWVSYGENLAHAFENKLNNAVGESHKNSKLKNSEVLEIKEKINKGQSCYSIAKQYGVNKVTILDIKNNKTWKHIPWPSED